jgi:hypothetical protein
VTRKKPVAVLVFGILNLVFGSLGLVMNLCCGLSIAGFYLMVTSVSQQAAPQDKKELEELWRAFSDNVPGLLPIVISSLAVSFLLGIMEIVSGIGLVRIRNWGRWLCAIWAVLQVLTVATSLFIQIVVVAPGMQKAMEDLQKWSERQQQRDRERGKNQGAPPVQFNTMGGSGNPYADNALTVAMSSFSLIYAGVAFVFMVLPQTGKAIARYNGKEDWREGEQDLYDDDYERKRRAPEQPPDGGEPRQSPGY